MGLRKAKVASLPQAGLKAKITRLKWQG